MGLEVLKTKLQKLTIGQTRIQKERTIKEHFVRWSHGGTVLSLPQFRMAMSELGINARTAEDLFVELDTARRGSVEIQRVIFSTMEEARGMQERSASTGDLRPPDRAPVKTGPAGLGRPSLLGDAEALRQRKIRVFWDLIGSRAVEKGYKSVSHLLKAMDKDDNQQLDRNEARRFFKVNLCLAVAKADEFFSLLDEDKDGKVSCLEIARCLAPYLQKSFAQVPEVPEWHDNSLATAKGTKDQELRRFFDLLGNRAWDKGFKSARQLLLQIDKDDNGWLDRKEMRNFLTYNAAFSSANADRFFELLDDQMLGKVSCKEIRRCLEPYFQKTFAPPAELMPELRTSHIEEAADNQQELKRFIDVIGTKFHEKGYRSAAQVLMTMDKDDSHDIDRHEVRLFFERHLGQGPNQADRFFDLLDANNNGFVSAKEFSDLLVPYFQMTFQVPGELVRDWEAAPHREAREARPEPGHAEARQAGRPSNTPTTPGRKQLLRHNSAPGWGSPRSGACLGSPGVERRPSGGDLRRDEAPSRPAAGRQPAVPPLDCSARNLAMDFPEPMEPMAAAPEMETTLRSRLDFRSPPGSEMGEAPLDGSGTFFSGFQDSGNRPAAGGRPRPRQAVAQPPRAENPIIPNEAWPSSSMPQGPPQAVDLSAAVLAELRRVILSRGGSHGIHMFGRSFRMAENGGDPMINAAELAVALRRFGLTLKQTDVTLLMHSLGEGSTGSISCMQFLSAVRGVISYRRLQLIDVAFACLDRNHDGRIEVRDIEHMYNVSEHPDVVAKSTNEEAALEDFLACFDADRDGFVTRKEFTDYYCNISPSMEDDDQFESFMRNSWRDGRQWPHQLNGERPSTERPERDSYVVPRPRRPAQYSPAGRRRS